MTDVLTQIEGALRSENNARRDEALDAAYVEIERLRTALRLARNDLLISIGEIDRELSFSSGDLNNG